MHVCMVVGVSRGYGTGACGLAIVPLQLRGSVRCTEALEYWDEVVGWQVLENNIFWTFSG